MLKPTKRKAFNFLRSYFDVMNELQTDSDKLNFLTSIINKQFLDEDPKDLNFIVNLCYESQRHQIEQSVKGWKRATSETLGTTPPTPSGTTPPTNPKEEEEKGEEEEEVKEKVKKEYSQEVLQTFDECLNLFPLHLHPKTKSIKNNWLDTVEKLIRIEKIPPDKIIEIVKKTRSDDFWSKNFLALPKLRKKNKDGIMNIVVFNERIKNETNKRTNSTGADPDELAELYAAKFAKFNQGK